MFKDKLVIGFRIEMIVEPDEDSFHAYCPALKGLHTCGDTEEEALQNARHAAMAYLQSLIKHGDQIPVGIVIHKEIEKILPPLAKHISRHTEDLKVTCAT